MMTKQEHISCWKLTASKDWVATKDLYRTKNYIQALFWSHLVLEKLLKAQWVKDNRANFPPKTHNLINLINQTSLQFGQNDMVFLEKMNDVQLEGRYPDYIKNIYKIYRQKENNFSFETS